MGVFRDKMLWSQQNQTANIWFSDHTNTLSDKVVKEAFNLQPFFVFHSSISLPFAITEVFNFTALPSILEDLEKLINETENFGTGFLKQYKFHYVGWDICLNII